jgi:hypothetical protein
MSGFGIVQASINLIENPLVRKMSESKDGWPRAGIPATRSARHPGLRWPRPSLTRPNSGRAPAAAESCALSAAGTAERSTGPGLRVLRGLGFCVAVLAPVRWGAASGGVSRT